MKMMTLTMTFRRIEMLIACLLVCSFLSFFFKRKKKIIFLSPSLLDEGMIRIWTKDIEKGCVVLFLL